MKLIVMSLQVKVTFLASQCPQSEYEQEEEEAEAEEMQMHMKIILK